MVRNPSHVLVEHQSRGDQIRAKFERVDPVLFVLLEIDSGFLHHVDRSVGEHVRVQGKAEVELPGMRTGHEVVAIAGAVDARGVGRLGGRQVTVGREERDAQLQHLDEIDVASEGLIVIVGFTAKRSHGPRHDTWEFGILSTRQQEVLFVPRSLSRDHRCLPGKWTSSDMTTRALGIPLPWDRHTMLMYGYFSTIMRSTAISCAKLPRQTSRMRPLAMPFHSD